MSTELSENALAETLLVGCGNMGFALLKGWLAEQQNLKVHVVEPDANLRERARSAGALAYADAASVDAGAAIRVIVIAVKPQYVCEILPQYHHFVDRGAFVLSVAAGVTIASMVRAAGPRAAIVRCMPNTPAAVGAGAFVCCSNQVAGEAEERVANKLLSPGGEVHFVAEEALMDAVTAVSGSGPAYIFHFIECLADAGTKAGLPDELAKSLALQTAYGASLLAKNSSTPAATLREQVTSPNGTTAAALSVLMAPDGLGYVVSRAVDAAKARSIELGKQ
jgi:pyrroline-5-carboxylate reductase